MNIVILLFTLICFAFPHKVFAQIHLNEIYPSALDGEYEWVELYNESDEELDLSCYEIFDSTGKGLKVMENTILPYSYVVATSSGILNNSGDTVYLSNRLLETVESITYETLEKGKSYSLCDTSWNITSSPTKNSTNNCNTVPETPTPTPTQSLSNGSNNLHIENIIISEIMPNPKTGENEWVELYNNNNYTVSLQNWFIDDIENGGSSPRSFSLTMDPYRYYIVEISSSMFNNTEDEVRLLSSSQEVIDMFEYSESSKEKSIGRVSLTDLNVCVQDPTKGYANSGCIDDELLSENVSTATPSPFEKTLGVEQKKEEEAKQKKPILFSQQHRPVITRAPAEKPTEDIETKKSHPHKKTYFPYAILASASASLSSLLYNLYVVVKKVKM